MNRALTRSELEELALACRELDLREDAERLEDDLSAFVAAAWPQIDPAPYLHNWALDAVCEHLQAVTEGDINRLLITIPFRCGKSNLASVCWPAWTWARDPDVHQELLSGPAVPILCGSYGDKLGVRLSSLTRRLILSPWYQARWGRRVLLAGDQNTKHQFDTMAGGSRIATSVSGGLLGIGGNIVLVDDPHNTEDVESEAERENVLNFWREISTTRLNDQKNGAIVVVMQRLHQDDVAGIILGESPEAWTHLMIPMRYEWERHCVTGIGWEDPRGLSDDGSPLIEIAADGVRQPVSPEAGRILDEERQGELMWPERFSEQRVEVIEAGLGPYMASGRLQQSPQPKSGGIFRREWWQLWTKDKYPAFDWIVASLDGAFTEKEENDPSALTVWGTFRDPVTDHVQVMLIDAWRKWLQMHGPETPRLPHEVPVPGEDQRTTERKEVAWKRRVSDQWQLCEWVAYTCRLRKVDLLLIEGKASGITAAQELQRIHGREGWGINIEQVTSDKVARALRVQPVFSQGTIWAPARDWSEMVIDEMESFPKGKYDDLTDSATQAIRHIRDAGLVPRPAEVRAAEREAGTKYKKLQPLYPV